MRFLRVIVPWTILFSTSCLAQQDLLDLLPQCAVDCFTATLPTTTCSPTDVSCLCLDTPFLTAAAGCNADNCTPIEVLQSVNETNAVCGISIRNAGATMSGVAIAFGTLSWLMVILRLVDRHFFGQVTLGWDDLLIGLSGLNSIGMTVPCLLSVHYGFGTDLWGLTPEQITKSFHAIFPAYIFYMTTEAFCQVSILAFYLRFMVDKKTLYFVKGLMVFVIAFGVANTLTMIFQVLPFNYFWDGWKGGMVAKYAINVNTYGLARGGIEIALDLVILALPLPILSKLQMSMKKKIQVMSMFCVGFVITGVSCARLHAYVQFAATSNPTYDNIPTIYWCLVEANLFIVVACMPAIQAALHRVLSPAHATQGAGYDRSDRSSYFNRSKDPEHSSNPQTFGGISKSTEVNVYHTKRSDASDVELVDRPHYMKDFDQRST